MISAHPCRRLFDNPINNSNLLWPDGHNKELTPEIAAEHPLFSIVDEIETQNGSNSTKENEFASKIADLIGVGGIGGSDAHSTEGIGSCYTKFGKSITSSEELIEAIKSKSFTERFIFDDKEIKEEHLVEILNGIENTILILNTSVPYK